MSDLDALTRHLLTLESALARRDPAGIGESLADLLDPDFTEHGASGRIWTRASVAEALADDPPRSVRLEGFGVALLSPGVALATYRSAEQADDGRSRFALRSSIWHVRDGRWCIRFHQGTLLPAGDAPADR